MASEQEWKRSGSIEKLEREITAGRIDGEEVERARAFWRERLADEVVLPNSERVEISARDVDHILLDARIRRRPDRIELLLHHMFEIRTGHSGRRRALSQWQEGERIIHGYTVLTNASDIITMHVTKASELRRMLRQGDLLWRRTG